MRQACTDMNMLSVCWWSFTNNVYICVKVRWARFDRLALDQGLNSLCCWLEVGWTHPKHDRHVSLSPGHGICNKESMQAATILGKVILSCEGCSAIHKKMMLITSVKVQQLVSVVVHHLGATWIICSYWEMYFNSENQRLTSIPMLMSTCITCRPFFRDKSSLYTNYLFSFFHLMTSCDLTDKGQFLNKYLRYLLQDGLTMWYLVFIKLANILIFFNLASFNLWDVWFVT